MRILVLSDIHANLEALETCLAAAPHYDITWNLGDLVGYGPDPNAVVERLRQVTDAVIRGNHDKACSGLTDAGDFNLLARLATDWTRKQLTPENISYLRSLPEGPLVQEGFQLVHGSPEREDEYLFGAAQALPELRKATFQITLFGHTHRAGPLEHVEECQRRAEQRDRAFRVEASPCRRHEALDVQRSIGFE